MLTIDDVDSIYATPSEDSRSEDTVQVYPSNTEAAPNNKNFNVSSRLASHAKITQ
jgi:hypothetical protein